MDPVKKASMLKPASIAKMEISAELPNIKKVKPKMSKKQLRMKKKAERIAAINAKKESLQDTNTEMNSQPSFSSSDYQMSQTQFIVDPADGASLMNAKYTTS